MRTLKNLCLKLALISSLGLTSLWAQTNDIDIFYNQTWKAAWDKCLNPYYNKDGDICFPCDNVILARLEIFAFWFQSHPFQNRFHDTLLNLEVQIEDGRAENDLLKNKLSNSRKRGARIAVVVGVVSAIGGGFLVYKLK